MTNFDQTILVITLNVNGLNSNRFFRMDEVEFAFGHANVDPITCGLQESHFKCKDTNRVTVK